jgi:hypothetical protein
LPRSKYVKKQTPELCLEAVKQNGYALYYVKKQAPELCLEAVKQNGYALKHVKKQTPEICLEEWICTKVCRGANT